MPAVYSSLNMHGMQLTLSSGTGPGMELVDVAVHWVRSNLHERTVYQIEALTTIRGIHKYKHKRILPKLLL